ncbi:MAG TPA: glycine cleavage system aminomethyltransferase GcvT [Candidatus Binataceae bacterium]|nr:glycine cleavage system aminomethyltransferase GcvT [Candidatus Binataceae bacterium]
METLRRTSLFELHRRLGARMTAFGGFEMPVSYAGIIDEHLAVRSRAGIFDLGHMGEFELAGAAALELLERTMTNSAARLDVGRAQYTLLCTPEGGTIDDLIVYRLDDARYMLCVNASNIGADRAWLLDLGAKDAGFRDVSEETGLVAVQGPLAQAILQGLSRSPLAAMRRFAVVEAEVAGVRCIVARTGYTGEDGFELFTAAAAAEKLFSAILEAGAPRGMMPCGLGARDTLRMEAGLALYGHELDRTTSPLEAGLDPFVKLGRDFVGAVALGAQRHNGLKRRLVGIRTEDGRSVARQGYKLFVGEREVGVMTSGTFAPSFNRPLGMAYLDTAAGAPGSIDVGIRNRRVAAAVTGLPFYRRGQPSAA